MYAYLLNSMDPSVNVQELLADKNHEQRAQKVLAEAERLGLRHFIQPADIVSGNQRLNFGFVANLFNNAKYSSRPIQLRPVH